MPQDSADVGVVRRLYDREGGHVLHYRCTRRRRARARNLRGQIEIGDDRIVRNTETICDTELAERTSVDRLIRHRLGTANGRLVECLIDYDSDHPRLRGRRTSQKCSRDCHRDHRAPLKRMRHELHVNPPRSSFVINCSSPLAAAIDLSSQVASRFCPIRRSTNHGANQARIRERIPAVYRMLCTVREVNRFLPG